MPKRSIADDEIALIKAMKARGMKTKDIQFLFNRPDRSVNTGRIRDIESGTYGPSASIPAASGTVVDAFIAGFSAPGISAIAVPAAKPPAPHNPVSPETLAALFARDGKLWRLRAGESDEHECKAAFGFRYSGKWLRAVAALANNRGGYVLFGVHDKDNEKKEGVDLSHAVVGLANTEFDDADTVKLTEHLKATFDPTPRVQKASIVVGGKSVGVIYVDMHPSRPVIATKQADDIREGDIFYRYPAQSSRIKYSDLRALLDQRDAHVRHQLMPLVEKLIALGPEKALIADLQAGSLVDGKHVIQMDDRLLDKLKFIKEGEFDEKAGAPTLRLIGEVETVGGAKIGPTKKGFISRDDLIGDFLAQEMKSDANEYIRAAVEGTQADWLPIHYFASCGGMSSQDVGDFIQSTHALHSRKLSFTRRAEGKLSAYRKAGGAGLAALEGIESGTLPAVETAKDASVVAAAVQGLKTKPPVSKDELLRMMADCFALASKNQVTMSVLRRALCRLDELLFPLASAKRPHSTV
jgi:hypothetical protein